MQLRIEATDREILRILERGPATPDEVSGELRIAWATAQGHLLKLVAGGKVVALRKGRVNVYMLRFPPKVSPAIPAFAKPRSLRELSEELQSFFPNDLSAAEMVGRERKRS